jgi:hypothetical protein
MSIFKKVELTWGGQEFEIPPEKVMGAIAVVEEIVTLQDLVGYAQKNSHPMSKMARAYGELLRYAGAKVTDEEVYLGMFPGNDKASVIESIGILLTMMIPPDHLKKAAADPTAVGNSTN